VLKSAFKKQSTHFTAHDDEGLGDKTASGVHSNKICDFNLRVAIGNRARTMHLKAVVWPDDTCTCSLLISRTDALKTGLITFVHDNDMREVFWYRGNH
jgi:hypothetical protein